MNPFDNMTNAFEQSLGNYKAGAGSIAQGKIQANEALTGGRQQLMRAGITADESIGTSEVQSKIAEGSQKLMKELGIDLSLKPTLAGVKGFADFAGGKAAKWTEGFQKLNNGGLTTTNPTNLTSEFQKSDTAFDVRPPDVIATPTPAGAGADVTATPTGAGAGADMATGAGAGDGLFGSVPTPFTQSADGAAAAGGESDFVSMQGVGGVDAANASRVAAARAGAAPRAPAPATDATQGGTSTVDPFTDVNSVPTASIAPDIFPTLPSQSWGMMPGEQGAGQRMGTEVTPGEGGGAAASSVPPPPATGGPSISSTGQVTPAPAAPAPTNPATQTQQPNQSFDDDPDVMDTLDTSRWTGGGGGAPDESLFNPSTAVTNVTEEASGLAAQGAAEVSTLTSTLVEGAGTVLGGIGGVIGDILPVVGPILAGVGLFEGFHKLNAPYGDAGPDPYASVRATLATGQTKLNNLGTQISSDQFATKVGQTAPAFGSLAAPAFSTAQQMSGSTGHF